MILKEKFFTSLRFWQKHIFISAHAFMAIVVIVDYTFGQSINKIIGNWFYVVSVATFAIAWYFLKKLNKNAGRYVLLLLYSGLAGVFLLYFTDPLGPYFQLLVLLLLTAAYWFGWIGVFVSLVVNMLFILLAVNYQQEINADVLMDILLRFTTLIVLSLLFGYTSKATRDRLKTSEETTLRQVVSLEHSRLVALVNSIGETVIITDLSGRILIYNGAALDLLNTNLALTGKKFTELIRLFSNDNKPYNIIKEAQATKKVIKKEDLHFIFNRKKIAIYISISPIRSSISEQANSGYIIIMRDITKEKTLDEERDEFIAVASHELRTPVAVAEANISTALLPQFAEKIDPKIQELLKQAHQNILFLANLVNDLSTLARAERGSLKLESDFFDPSSLLKQLHQTYLDEAKNKRLKFSIKIPAEVPKIYNSELYVREILQNFITNALKYTMKGSITLAVKKASPHKVLFSIKDSGIGIAENDKKRLFKKFSRSESYQTRQTRGTGLGLYITTKLADKIGAKIHYESKLNHGSTFYLLVPSLKKKLTER